MYAYRSASSTGDESPAMVTRLAAPAAITRAGSTAGKRVETWVRRPERKRDSAIGMAIDHAWWT